MHSVHSSQGKDDHKVAGNGVWKYMYILTIVFFGASSVLDGLSGLSGMPISCFPHGLPF